MLTLVVLLFAVSNLIWWARDLVPPMWDQSDYLLHAQYLYQALTEDGLGAFYVSLLKGLAYKAPLLTTLPAPLYLIFGTGYKTAMLSNLVFMIAGSYFLFRLGELLVGRTEGIIAVLILHTFPLVFAMSREFLVEYGLMVIVIAWFYFILKPGSFRNVKVSGALGVVLGLGLLMKISFPLYAFLPTLFVLTILVRQKNVSVAEILRNGAVLAGIAAVIAVPWYLRNMKHVIDFAMISGYSERAKAYGMGEVFSLRTIFSYWGSLVDCITTYWLVLLLASAAVAFKRTAGNPLERSHRWVLILWFAAPFVIFTLGVNKDVRYITPILPVIALALGACMGRLWKIKYWKIPVLVVLTLALLNFAHISFSGKTISAGRFVVLRSWLAYAHPPIRENWPLDGIVSAVRRDAARNGLEGTAATLLFNHEYLNFINLGYYGAMQKAQVRFNTNEHYATENIDQTLDRIRKESGYLITKSDLTGPDITNTRNKEIAMRLVRGELPFQRLWDIELPDKTTLSFYRNKKPGMEAACKAEVPPNSWRGEYFANKELSGPPAMTRDDGGRLNFNWDRTSPNSQCGIGSENFSVRWTRDVAFKGGTYRFVMTVDDGGRLYVDGKLLIDKWIDQGPSTYTADVAIAEGSHHIVMEYYQHVGGMTAVLKIEPR